MSLRVKVVWSTSTKYQSILLKIFVSSVASSCSILECHLHESRTMSTKSICQVDWVKTPNSIKTGYSIIYGSSLLSIHGALGCDKKAVTRRKRSGLNVKTYTGWRKKNGATLSHCKYSEKSMTELRGNWWTSAILYAEHSH